MKTAILVPFDFSEGATQALAWAADLQSTVKSQTPIHLVHVVSSYVMGDPMSVEVMLPTAEDVEALEDSLREAAARVGARVVPDVIVRPLSVGEVIVARADELHTDLVVMGTHGRTGVKRVVLGSVAEHVVRHSPCPVVTVRTHRPSEPR